VPGTAIGQRRRRSVAAGATDGATRLGCSARTRADVAGLRTAPGDSVRLDHEGESIDTFSVLESERGPQDGDA
jgi:hypothetical protein